MQPEMLATGALRFLTSGRLAKLFQRGKLD
jgi:hypothetical protein